MSIVITARNFYGYLARTKTVYKMALTFGHNIVLMLAKGTFFAYSPSKARYSRPTNMNEKMWK